MTTTIATKGQIVIPKSIRDRLDIGVGDDFEIWADEGGEIILRPLGGKKNAGLVDHLCAAPEELEIPKRSVETAKPIEF